MTGLVGAQPPEHLGSLIDNATQDRDLVLAADVFIRIFGVAVLLKSTPR